VSKLYYQPVSNFRSTLDTDITGQYWRSSLSSEFSERPSQILWIDATICTTVLVCRYEDGRNSSFEVSLRHRSVWFAYS
jgi:hypothetical protein